MTQYTQRLEGANSDGTSWVFRGHLNAAGLRHGHGECKTFWRNTDFLMSTYTGNWVNDVRSGRGTVLFREGHLYDGEWCNGEGHGQGVYHSPVFKR